MNCNVFGLWNGYVSLNIIIMQYGSNMNGRGCFKASSRYTQTFLSSICLLFADSARRMRGSLAEQVVLPCYFSILPPPTGSSAHQDHLRIKWTKLVGDEEITVLVTQNGFLKIGPEFKDRVRVPQRSEDEGDASLTIERLRASDAGAYRCEVMHGIEDTQETISLDVSGQSLCASYERNTASVFIWSSKRQSV